MSKHDLDADDLERPIKRTDGDTLEERLTANAYHNILPARYLRKDADGNLIEDPEDLFPRVAKNIALAEAAFEARRRDVDVTVTPAQLKPDHPRRDELAAEVFGARTTVEDDVETTLSPHNVNKFAYDTVVPELPDSVRSAVEETRDEFQELMEDLSFMPNSPTLMNAGDELQQLSACFVDSPEDDIDDIHQTAKEAAQVFQCLTDDARVHVDGKGVVSIADVEPGDSIRQRDGDGYAFRTVEEIHAYDDAPTKTVVTEGNVELTGTPNHRLLVDGEWTELGDIEPGDTVSVRLGWIPDRDETDSLAGVDAGARWSAARTVSNEEIAELHAAGLNDYEIAERLDSSPSTVQRRRNDDLDLPANGDGGRPSGRSFDEATFEQLYEIGHTDAEVASELDVHETTVRGYRAARSLEASGVAVKEVTQPTELSTDLAELVGIWVGDGSVHEDGIRFHVNRDDVLNEIDSLSRRLFDIGIDHTWADGCYEAVIHSHEVKRWWLSHFGDAKTSSAEACVPDCLWKADHDTVHAFLRGLFSTDGTLTRGKYPRFYSASENLVDGVLQLLLGVGIPATKWAWEHEDRDYYSVAPTDERGLSRFAESVGFVDARTDEMLDELAETTTGETTTGRLDGETVWEQEIVAVEDAGTNTVYDVTVADNHEYVASSVVSHNSGGGMGYAFWRLRPYGDPVGSTGGIASGPITFMRTFDQMCFPPGTGVLTPDGYRDIERLEPGDLVIDEAGETQPVVETMERGVDEDLVEVTPERLNEPIRATGEHPFKVVRDDGFEWIDARDLSAGDLLVLGHATESNDLALDATADLSTLASGPLTFADGGATINREYYGADRGPRPEPVETEVPVADLATLAGWYLAEGCVVYRRGVPNEVTFTLHADERSEAAEIVDALASFGVAARTDPVEERNTLHVHAESSSFAQLVEGLFGTGASTKRVPEFLWKAPPETQARVLEALFDGDGTLETRGQSQRMKLQLTCEEVVDFVVQAGLRCGVQFSRHSRTPDDRLPTYWASASVSTALGTPLERLFDEVPDDFRSHDRTKRAHGREVVAVDSVDTVAYEGPVHNVEVAGTHTYVAEDVVVHNCETIAQGGARRGAQMGVMRVSHPDVIQFIHAKNKDVSLAHTLRLNDPDDFTHNSFADALEEARELIDDEGRVPKHLRNAVEGHLSNFNISVGVTDEFMAALENGEEFTFTNPRTGEPHVATPQTKELYEMFDLGEYVEVGEELSMPAEVLWEDIVEGAHENGEPGVIYLERVNKQHSFDTDEHPEHEILATNPCGEQPLEEYEACNLGHINLSTLAAADAPDWRVWSERHAEEYDTHAAAVEAFLTEAVDWEEFDRRIESGTRFLENVVTMSDFPVEEIEAKVREMRKIGLGIMGLAQLYVQLGMKYGSDTSNEVARQLMTHIDHRSKWASHELADERGVFEDWTESKYADPTAYREWFEHHTGEDAEDWEDGFPIRNHNTTTIAPTGTTSMVGNTTGGCEPIYNVAYYKNVSDDVQGDEMLVEFDDYFLRTLEANDVDVEAVKREAEEQMAENEFDGVDGLDTVPDAIGELFVVTGDLSGKGHAAVQCACQEGVDSAISKCIEEGTLVQTDQGLVPIEGFSDNDEPGTFSDVDGEYTIDGHAVTAHYYAGSKPSTRIRLDSGAELVGATESHRVLTPDGWELLSDLTEGDVVLGEFAVSHSDGGRHIEWEDDLRTSANGVETPARMSPAFAEFLGMVAADGGAYEETGRVEITTDTLAVEDRYADLCDRLFDERVSVEYDDRTENVRRVYLTSRNLARCVRSLVGEGAYGKRVPDQVVRGSAEEKLAFVRGLTLDGHNDSNGFTVYGGMSEELAYGTAQLLRSFGVPKVYEGRKWVPKAEAHEHLVTVSNELQDLVSAIEPHKNPEPQFVRYKVPVDTVDLSLDDYETGTSTYYAVRSARNRDQPYLFDETAERIGVDYSGIAYKVTDVEDVGERELYDIEVEDAHRYLVNGMISHNTCNFPNSATVEDMDEVYRYIYEHGGKGVTVYRDGTRSKQVLTTRAQNTEFADESEAAEALVEQIESVFDGLEGFLDNEDVRAALDAQVEELLSAADGERELGTKRPRPDVLHGVTQRIDTGYGKLYVNINEDEAGQPFELFANIGNSGGFTASFTEALAKTISTALRSGVDPRELASELQGIRSPKVAWDKGEQINSIPDAIGTAMRRYLDGDIDKPYPKQQNLTELEKAEARAMDETDGGTAVAADDGDASALVDAGESPECPECGSMSLHYAEGCKTCESCGWSEC